MGQRRHAHGSVASYRTAMARASLRNMLKRYTGLRPADLRAPTALAALCTRFLETRATLAPEP